MKTKPTKQRRARFEKYHLGLSLFLNPTQARVVLHMEEILHMERMGLKTDYTRGQLMERMGLGEYAFDSAMASLLELGLIVKSSDSSRNRVHYSLDWRVYDRLVGIVSATQNIDKLEEFLDLHLRKGKRRIESITDEEIDELHP